MSDTLYLQLDQNILVNTTVVHLGELAELTCSNAKLLNRLSTLPVIRLNPQLQQHYVLTAAEIIRIIQDTFPSLTVTALGEPTIVLTYNVSPKEKWGFVTFKVILICLLSFFGSAFSIMTFHNDVDMRKLFSQIYTLVTGQVSSGFTVLEISYSIGIGIGVLFFFNHFGKMKCSSDPSPMQVQMQQYEEQVNATVIEQASRMKTSADKQVSKEKEPVS